MNPDASSSAPRATTSSAFWRASSSRRALSRPNTCGRDPLREHRHDVVPLGGERLVEDRRDADVGERLGRGATGDGVLERPFEIVDRLGQHDRAAVDRRIVAGLGAELGREAGRSLRLTFKDVAAADFLSALNRGDHGSPRPALLALHVLQVRDLQVRRRPDHVGVGLVARLASRTTPVARPPWTTRCASTVNGVGADLGSVATVRPPCALSAGTPMPPSGKPQEPIFPSPTSPISWWRRRPRRCPPIAGPAPRADDAADRGQRPGLRGTPRGPRRRRSATLMLIIRVMSACPSACSPRNFPRQEERCSSSPSSSSRSRRDLRAPNEHLPWRQPPPTCPSAPTDENPSGIARPGGPASRAPVFALPSKRPPGRSATSLSPSRSRRPRFPASRKSVAERLSNRGPTEDGPGNHLGETLYPWRSSSSSRSTVGGIRLTTYESAVIL